MVYKANLIASHYEYPKCKKNIAFARAKGSGWRLRMALPQPGVRRYRHGVVRSVRRRALGFSESKLAITIILRLTRYWFGKSMNAFVVNDLKVNKNRSEGLVDDNFHEFLASMQGYPSNGTWREK
ncbi:hypothetical protein TNCV_207161 [Trichonephila clavipes]|nr:hypothetical protein TNCV_207161 [Trichonephila clavipes]